jgi:hypothetical protein
MKTLKIIFPLCLLNYPKEKTEKYNLIISYGVVSFAYRLLKNPYDEPSMERLKDYVLENEIINFDENTPLDNHIIYACMITGLVIKDINKSIIEYCKIRSFVESYEKKYGTDSLVKIGSDLLLEVQTGKFNERLFRCYCAIKSILGKSDFCRITNKTISFRMKGFKRLDVMNTENVNNNETLSDRQIKTLTINLQRLKFIERGTYKKRCTYYSIKYRGDRFNEKLSDFLSSRKAKRERPNIQNEILNNLTDEKHKKKLEEMREKKTVNCKIFDIKEAENENDLQGLRYGER